MGQPHAERGVALFQRPATPHSARGCPTGNNVSLVRKRIGIRQSLQAMLFSSLIAVSVAALFTIVSLPAAAASQELGAMKMEKSPELHEVSTKAGSQSESRTNRLIREKSPYLLQHAYNPVDWYAWGDEAFEKARKEDKPIFLSIGYSTCHWCHVMEHESFEDTEVARLMNEAFVSIKVDREERPDLDHVYMTVCQMMTGSGRLASQCDSDSGQKALFRRHIFSQGKPFRQTWDDGSRPAYRGIVENAAGTSSAVGKQNHAGASPGAGLISRPSAGERSP